jgi:hypothetical protein
MGGKLFNLGRISKDKYLQIDNELRQYLNGKLGNYYRIPRYYENKIDFGDVDIIISSQAFTDSWQSLRQEIIQDLNITQYKSDGHVFSTVYQNFQVDYFVAESDFFESTYNYLSFNDLGNLIGKICRKFNLKYGDEGLSYVFRRSGGNYQKDLLVTTDFKAICDFLKLDFDRWEKGFKDLEDIFSWINASTYFSVKPYVEKSNTLLRREKERTTIQKFIEYLHGNKIDRVYEYLDNRDEYLKLIDGSFPEAKLLEKIDREKKEEEKQALIKSKFNGKMIMDLIPNLKDKELGMFILEFKNQFSDFEQFIIDTPAAEIIQEILDYYQIFIKNLG